MKLKELSARVLNRYRDGEEDGDVIIYKEGKSWGYIFVGDLRDLKMDDYDIHHIMNVRYPNNWFRFYFDVVLQNGSVISLDEFQSLVKEAYYHDKV